MKHLKNLLLLATRSIKKIGDPSNAKKHYNSYLKRKSYKICKTIKYNYSATKKVLNPIIVDIKSVKNFT